MLLDVKIKNNVKSNKHKLIKMNKALNINKTKCLFIIEIGNIKR